jgi:four helix bundle protein
MADHRSLPAWKSARAATGIALRIFRQLNSRAPAAFFEQLCSATLSVQLTIVEGYALGTRPQFRRHLAIAFGSAVEVEDLLTTILEERLIAEDLGSRALVECRRSKVALLGLLKKFRPMR